MRNLNFLTCIDHKFSLGDNHSTRNALITIDNINRLAFVAHGRNIVAIKHENRMSSNDQYSVRDIIVDLPCSSQDDYVIHLEYLIEQQLIVFFTYNGLIGTYDHFSKTVDFISSLESEIDAVAFSPDFDLAAIVTSNKKLLLVNRDYEILTEVTVCPTGHGQDSFVTVGWGKKETQFHGSEGKTAALTKKQDVGLALSNDDKHARISWRGDALFFAVSVFDEESCTRTIRIFTREGVHSTTCESINGLGQCLAWRPKGNLIASAQYSEQLGHQVIFFERNGLRHGEFKLPTLLPSNLKILEVKWNLDSSIMALHCEDQDEPISFLFLYTSSNYHWYMKKCLKFSTNDRLSSFIWDLNDANCLHLVTDDQFYRVVSFSYAINRFQGAQADDSDSTVAVCDASSILITSLANTVIPPPMSGCAVECPGFVNIISFGFTPNTIFATLHDNSVAVLNRKGSNSWNLSRTLKFDKQFDGLLYKFCMLNEKSFFAVNSNDGNSIINVWAIDEDNNMLISKFSDTVKESIQQIFPNRTEKSVWILWGNGQISIFRENFTLEPFTSSITKEKFILTSNCTEFEVLKINDDNIVLSRNERNQLFVDGRQIANNVSSFIIHDSEYVLMTTLSHRLLCVPVKHIIQENFRLENTMEGARNLERGSRIVASQPSETKLILQMPRGNLETIYPRCLLLSVIKKLLDKCDYKKTISLMKRHRLDTNLIYDHDHKKFLSNIDVFVDTIQDSLLFNIFLSELKAENVTETIYAPYYAQNERKIFDPKNKINEICCKMRHSLERPCCDNGAKYFTSLLTTHVKMEPPDFDSALILIQNERTKNENSKLVDEGLRHLLYLVDVNLLIDVALGTYDFNLVLMVAEKSQKDPKELLPFLNELQKLEPDYRMYKIDMHLGRFEKALGHIVACGPSKFDECAKLVKDKKLYVDSLELFRNQQEFYKKICKLYGDYLSLEKKFIESGIFYEKSGEKIQAMEAYCNALEPTLFINVAKSLDTEPETLSNFVEKLGDKLKDAKRHKEAADFYAKVGKDLSAQISCLVQGGHFLRAYSEIASTSNKNNLMEKLLKPSLNAYFSTTNDWLQKNRTLYQKYYDRLKVVRANKKVKLEKVAESGDYDVDDDTFSEIGSTISGVSTKLSTRASTNARAKRILAKKEEKKRFVLKENTPHEDLALLNALNDIVKQLDLFQEHNKNVAYYLDTVRTIWVHLKNRNIVYTIVMKNYNEIPDKLHLALLIDMEEQASTLQTDVKNFVKFVESTLETIWPVIIDLSLLPGPLSENISYLNEHNISINDKLMNLNRLACSASIKLDPLLIRPQIRSDFNWTVDFYKR